MRKDCLPTTYEGALTHIIQEASEVIKAITKLQMFGYCATDPLTGITYDNRRKMLEEFNDLEHALRTVRNYHRNHDSLVVAIPDIPVQELSPPTKRFISR